MSPNSAAICYGTAPEIDGMMTKECRLRDTYDVSIYLALRDAEFVLDALDFLAYSCYATRSMTNPELIQCLSERQHYLRERVDDLRSKVDGIDTFHQEQINCLEAYESIEQILC